MVNITHSRAVDGVRQTFYVTIHPRQTNTTVSSRYCGWRISVIPNGAGMRKRIPCSSWTEIAWWTPVCDVTLTFRWAVVAFLTLDAFTDMLECGEGVVCSVRTFLWFSVLHKVKINVIYRLIREDFPMKIEFHWLVNIRNIGKIFAIISPYWKLYSGLWRF